MSVLAVSGRDVRLPGQEPSSLSVSDFSIAALMAGNDGRRTPPVYRSAFAAAPTPPDGVFCGGKEALTPSPTPPALRQLSAPVDWISQMNTSAVRRLLPANFQLSNLTGK